MAPTCPALRTGPGPSAGGTEITPPVPPTSALRCRCFARQTSDEHSGPGEPERGGEPLSEGAAVLSTERFPALIGGCRAFALRLHKIQPTSPPTTLSLGMPPAEAQPDCPGPSGRPPIWCFATSFLAVALALLGVALSITGLVIAASRPPVPSTVPSSTGLDICLLVLCCVMFIAAAAHFAQVLLGRPFKGFLRWYATEVPSSSTRLGLTIAITVLVLVLCAFVLSLTAKVMSQPPSPYIRNPLTSAPLTLGITSQMLTQLSSGLFRRWWNAPAQPPLSPAPAA